MIEFAKRFLLEKTRSRSLSDLSKAVLAGGDLGLVSEGNLRYAAELESSILIGRARFSIAKRLLLPDKLKMVEEVTREITSEGKGIYEILGTTASLDTIPKVVRSRSQWIDSGDPWLLVSERDNQRIFQLELLEESDAAWEFNEQFGKSIDRLLSAPAHGYVKKDD